MVTTNKLIESELKSNPSAQLKLKNSFLNNCVSNNCELSEVL